MGRPSRWLATVLVALAALATTSCQSKGSTVLVVTVGLMGSLPPVSALDVTIIGPSGRSHNVYGVGRTIDFPTTFTAQLPSSVTGEVTLDVKALDAAEKTVAHGLSSTFSLHVGTRQTIAMRLDCGGAVCVIPGADAGAPSDAGSAAGGGPTCGNGRIDLDESCDTAIAAGAPGACPPASCDDGIACTTDTRVGQGCQVECRHVEVTDRLAGDGCCPAGATNATDTDCSSTCGDGHVDKGETCDTAIPPGAPGACPTAATCDEGNPCTTDAIVSVGTCDASCAHTPVTRQSGATRDGCCPVGAWAAADADCPIACGDGRIEADELCDPGFPANDPHACPTSCDDGDPCTIDVLEGSACRARCVSTPITALVSGDGCCPAGATSRTDRDCAPVCGNGVVEGGESCDTAAATPGGECPKSCSPSPSACLKNVLVGATASCTARCELQEVTKCGGARDGCCAVGCTATTDPDCSATCGDGVVQAANGETCDLGIAEGKPGACPTSCTDGLACTRDVLVARGTCQAACIFVPITTARAGDGCCAPGTDASLDPDCEPLCGNGVAEGPGETCDYGASPLACPTTCLGGDACTPIRIEGVPASCNARCVAHPVTACVSGDGCCPAWCTIANDSDCSVVCGDGVLSAGETCDRAITAGLAGACARTCDDGDACTADWAAGTIAGCSRTCGHAAIAICRDGDGCCPPGCDSNSDADCVVTCGDGQIGAGETCDPPSTCPSQCPDDGDTCTREVLVGEPERCTAACRHPPITACSGKTADFCCPTGCSAGTDVDCPAHGPPS
ncbi:MAG TPA: hypothetical protein VHK47_15960 [Polyangia bacterium]|jgi:hypothetical protein|nr:hypothetical protein [Polyangia bacterium]